MLILSMDWLPPDEYCSLALLSKAVSSKELSPPWREGVTVVNLLPLRTGGGGVRVVNLLPLRTGGGGVRVVNLLPLRTGCGEDTAERDAI